MNQIVLDFVKSIFLSIVITLISLILLSIILSTSNISENIISPAIIIISSVSILIGSFFISRKIKERGILNGAIFIKNRKTKIATTRYEKTNISIFRYWLIL